MACEWCGLSTDSGNHATTADCIEALEVEVVRLRQVIDDRKRFAERVEIRKGYGRRVESERAEWRFRAK